MKLVLFDIDGTLLTSSGVGRSAVRQAVESVCGYEINVSGVAFAGRTDPAIIRDLLSTNSIHDDQVDELLPDCLKAYTSALMHFLTPSVIHVLPGINELVRTLHRTDEVSMGLLTGNLRETAYLKLHAAGLGSFFGFGAFGSDREHRNDLPGVAVEQALTMTGLAIPPGKTVIVGDTPHDIECAKSHGAHCVGVSTGQFSIDELAECGPDLLVNDFGDPSEFYAFLSQI